MAAALPLVLLAINVVATVLGIARVIALSLDAANPSLGFDFRLLPWQWVVLGALPLVVALLAMFTARRTVMRSLARMP